LSGEEGWRFKVGCWKPWAVFLLQALFLKPLTSNHICLSLPITLASFFRVLLEFSCQPIKHRTGHFRHCFSGML
jgi:hypothetical protein